MNILKSWKTKVLFGYYTYPAEEWRDMEDAGFSFRLFADGTVLVQTYSLDCKRDPRVIRSERIALPEETVGKITRILAGYAKEIQALPEFTDNGSCDGTFYDFVFSGQYISSLNIQRTDMVDVILDNPEYYEKYRFNMADENMILDIFTRITEAMKKDGVELYLRHLKIHGEKIR